MTLECISYTIGVDYDDELTITGNNNEGINIQVKISTQTNKSLVSSMLRMCCVVYIKCYGWTDGFKQTAAAFST